jgi:hypothetical protein
MIEATNISEPTMIDPKDVLNEFYNLCVVEKAILYDRCHRCTEDDRTNNLQDF